MKIYRALLVLMMCLLVQLSVAQRWSMGLHGGYSAVLLKGHPVYNQSINAWGIGIGANYGISGLLSICAEVNYELKGAEGTVSYYNSNGDKVLDYTKKQELHYITLPVMVRFSAGVKNIKAFLNLGGYYGFLAGAWVNPQDRGVSHDVTPAFNRNDVGFAGGLGVSYQLGTHYTIGLEWRNNAGLTNVSKHMASQYNRSTIFEAGINYCF